MPRAITRLIRSTRAPCALARRAVVAFLVGVLSAGGAWLFDAVHPIRGTDSHWSLVAARSLLAGGDPYAQHTDASVIPYPLPAAIIAVPFAPLPDEWWAPVFIGLSATLLAFGVTRDNEWWRLILFCSAPYVMAVSLVQWSPLMFAALLYPALLPLVVVKPTVGLAVASVTRLTRAGFTFTILLVGTSLIISPSWPSRWYPLTRSYYGFVPLLTIPGSLLLLALVRWRDARARFLLALAVVPQQVFFYDQLLLWHIPITRRQIVVLTMFSWIALVGTLGLWDFRAGPWLAVSLMYLPALAMVLHHSIQNTVRRFGSRAFVTRKSPKG